MLTIPEELWQTLLDVFAKQPGRVERVAYLDGIHLGDDGVVTTITIPDAELTPGRYRVSTEAMSQAGRAIRGLGLERLAQVHTHPTEWVGHSGTDDALAYSQRAGAISIVLAHHATHRPLPHEDGGVHLREQDKWRDLSVGEGAALVRVVPSLLDFRPPITIKRKWWQRWRR